MERQQASIGFCIVTRVLLAPRVVGHVVVAEVVAIQTDLLLLVWSAGYVNQHTIFYIILSFHSRNYLLSLTSLHDEISMPSQILLSI